MTTETNTRDIIPTLNGAPVRLAIIGLGYVGLPLAVEFGKKYPVTGFDLSQAKKIGRAHV